MVSKLKQPKPPRNLPMFEMQAILGGRKRGKTHKEIKAGIDELRKDRGTFTGQGISTNTISRMLGKTHKVTFKAATEKAWYIYAKKKAQVSHMDRIANQIEDPKERARFMRFARQQSERQKGRQYELEVGYDAESDEYYVNSP